jgi:hypothetical protein
VQLLLDQNANVNKVDGWTLRYIQSLSARVTSCLKKNEWISERFVQRSYYIRPAGYVYVQYDALRNTGMINFIHLCINIFKVDSCLPSPNSVIQYIRMDTNMKKSTAKARPMEANGLWIPPILAPEESLLSKSLGNPSFFRAASLQRCVHRWNCIR